MTPFTNSPHVKDGCLSTKLDVAIFSEEKVLCSHGLHANLHVDFVVIFEAQTLRRN